MLFELNRLIQAIFRELLVFWDADHIVKVLNSVHLVLHAFGWSGTSKTLPCLNLF